MLREYFYFTQFTSFLLAVLTLMVLLAWRTTTTRNDDGKTVDDDDLSSVPEPPGPTALPIIGHLHLLAGHRVPYEAFTLLKRKYGDIVKLRLGYVDALIVNGQKSIRDVLVNKGHLFDSRPNFERYRKLFGGNKENSLAFCNWSDVQKNRRDMLKAHTFPRAFTDKFDRLEEIIARNVDVLLGEIAASETAPFEIKSSMLYACGNIFANHFCTTDFDASHDRDFRTMIADFDEVFYEVNQGYAADFLPFLMPLHRNNLARMNRLTENIRDFILRRIIRDRYAKYEEDIDDFAEPEDYVDSLIRHVKGGTEPGIDWDAALYALEDIVGGHSAVGNFLVKVFAYLANEPRVQETARKEIESVTRSHVNVFDRNRLPYTESVVFEAIRLIASPIVPRVANQDCVVSGYKVRKDTVVFLNNHELSMSEDLWTDPERFEPERFVVDGRFVKPDHFLPFGGGRRSCMGYKMVQLITFSVVANVLQKYDILPAADGLRYDVPVGSLALPTRDTFRFRFVPKRQAETAAASE